MYNETYSTRPALAYEGMVADTEPAVIISRTVEDASLGFGKVATQGAGDHGVTPTITGAASLTGVAVRSQSTDVDAGEAYPEGDTAALLRKGVIWVKVTDAGGVSADDPVWVDLANNAFSNADVGSGNGLKLAGASWVDSGANGALARIRVNFDVPAVAGAA